jgi:hypothetical protein
MAQGRARLALLFGHLEVCLTVLDGRPPFFLWERALCATSLRSGGPNLRGRAQGALPQGLARRGVEKESEP